MELGAAALEFLTGTWELHLTPSEAASVADNVSASLLLGMGAGLNKRLNLAMQMLARNRYGT